MKKMSNINKLDRILINKERTNDELETVTTSWSTENHVYPKEEIHKISDIKEIH